MKTEISTPKRLTLNKRVITCMTSPDKAGQSKRLGYTTTTLVNTFSQ